MVAFPVTNSSWGVSMNPIEGLAAETSGETARSGSDSEMGRVVPPPHTHTHTSFPPFLSLHAHCMIKILTNWSLRVSLQASSLGRRVSDRCDSDLIS